jgi:DNA-binding MarR family transcriptional regulator
MEDDNKPVSGSLAYFVEIFPEIVYAVNDILEDSTQELSKKEGVFLLSIHLFGKDDSGKYLEIGAIRTALQKWFVIKEHTAKSAVSRCKNRLLKDDYIFTKKNPKRVYLEEKGAIFAEKMIGVITQRLNEVLRALNDEEREKFLRYLKQIVGDIETEQEARAAEALQLKRSAQSTDKLRLRAI